MEEAMRVGEQIDSVVAGCNLKIENKPRQRQTGLELLRIFSMICIVAHHLSCHGNGSLAIGFNRILMQIFLFGGKYGVDIFVLLSGYCLIKSKFTTRKLFKLLTQVIFYCVFIYLILLCCGQIQFNAREMVRAFFPTLLQHYWFVTCYVVVYIFSPYINKMLKSLTRKEYTIFMVLAFSVLFAGKYLYFVSPSYVWFFAMYMLGAGISLHPLKIYSSKLFAWLFLFAMVVFVLLVKDYTSIFVIDSVFVIFSAVATLLCFKNVNVQSEFINRIASGTFGVYLIHENKYLRSLIWDNIFKTYSIMDSNILILIAPAIVIAIVVVGIVIDLLRQRFVEKYLLKFYDFLSEKLKIKKQKQNM